MSTIPSHIGNFEVTKQIGTGGMGAVYLGRDPELNRKVAIKVIRAEVHDQEVLDRFFREARAAAALRHPNIITIYASGQHEHQPYMVMEFVEGESLAAIIRHQKALPLADKLSYLEQLCAGLHFAHRAGIVHRDIKPANIMIDSDGVLRILDFGIARVEGSGLTQDGALIGSLNYMSPEQMLGRTIDPRSDIFSVGAVAYELISYQQAFKGNINDGLLHRLPHEDPPPLGTISPGLPAGLEEAITRALQKVPEYRFQDLAEMRNAIIAVRSATVSAEDQTLVISRSQTGATADAKPVPRNIDSRFDFDNVKEEFPDFTISQTPRGEQPIAPPVAEPEAPAPPAFHEPITSIPVELPAEPETWSITRRPPVSPGIGREPLEAPPPRTIVPKPPPPAAVRPPTTTVRSTTTVLRPQPARNLRRRLLGVVVALGAGAALALPYLTAPADPHEAERRAVLAAMERFRIGYRNRDMDAVLAAFPGLPADVRRTMQRTFDDCIIYEVTFDSMNLSLPADATNAQADVRSTHTCTQRSRGSQTTTMQHDVYALRKNGNGWVLSSVKKGN